MKEALLDTDILSFYFKGNVSVVNKVGEYLQHFEQLNISIITYYEIVAGLKFKNAQKQLKQFEDFATSNNIILVSENSAKISAEIYARLRTKGVMIGTSDILIAGIAIENELTLITNNVKHYGSIVDLNVENWNNLK